MLETMTHSVARKQFIKTTVGRRGGCPREEGTGASSPEETLYECNRQYETIYLRRPTPSRTHKCTHARAHIREIARTRTDSGLFRALPLSLSHPVSHSCSIPVDLALLVARGSNWWLHRRVVPATPLASFRSVCSQIERKSERINARPWLRSKAAAPVEFCGYHRRCAKAARSYPYGSPANSFGRAGQVEKPAKYSH